MKYVIFDMEWNQSYAVRNGLAGEIVQIGAVRLNDRFEQEDTYSVIIKPRFYKKLMKRVAQLTNLTQEQVDAGIPFKEAMEQFFTWCGADFCFMTWGYDDIPMLIDNMKAHRLDPSRIPKNYNLQQIFDMQITKEKRQCSLSRAMELVNEPELEAHDALHDAINTAHLIHHLDMERGFAEYSDSITGALISGRCEKEFDDPLDALRDDAVIAMTCPKCGETLRCENWISANFFTHVGAADCVCGEKYYFSVRMKRKKRIQVNRSVYPMDEEHAERYAAAVEKQKKKKTPAAPVSKD